MISIATPRPFQSFPGRKGSPIRATECEGMNIATRFITVVSLLVFVMGCGSSDEGYVAVTAPRGPVSVSDQVSAADGGRLEHPETGHAARFSPGSLSNDSQVTMSLVSPESLLPHLEKELEPVGLGFRLELSQASSFQGDLHIAVPHPNGNDQQQLYCHIDDRPPFPVLSFYDEARSAFVGILDSTALAAFEDGPRSLTVCVVLEPELEPLEL